MYYISISFKIMAQSVLHVNFRSPSHLNHRVFLIKILVFGHLLKNNVRICSFKQQPVVFRHYLCSPRFAREKVYKPPHRTDPQITIVSFRLQCLHSQKCNVGNPCILHYGSIETCNVGKYGLRCTTPIVLLKFHSLGSVLKD